MFSVFNEFSTAPNFDPNVNSNVINQMFSFYQCCFRKQNKFKQLIIKSNFLPTGLLNNENLGVSDRSLGRALSGHDESDFGNYRGALRRAGLILNSGHELFRGCIVVPKYDSHGGVTSAIGYRFGARVRQYQNRIIFWKMAEIEGLPWSIWPPKEI